MAALRERFASTRDTLLVFATCAFSVFLVSILTVLRSLPAWMLRMSAWDLVGAFAYTQALALLDTLLLFCGLLSAAPQSVAPVELARTRGGGSCQQKTP